MVEIKNGRRSPAIFETLHILMGNWFSSRLTASLGMSIKLLHAFTANSGISKKKKKHKKFKCQRGFNWNDNNTGFHPQI